jgi:isoleucyl-tRNA synthetase
MIAKQYIVQHFAGSTLVGRHYTPLLPFFAHMRTERSAFRVVADDYVTVDVGTGIVHQAPYFGEDDMRVCERERIIEKGMK